jgi:peptide/nickel transport system ATP-binding protein
MMRKLKHELNSALLLITHDLGVVASICDIIGVMYAGEIVEFGTLEDIFDPDKKHHPYTVGLFGAIPNLKVKTARLSPIQGMRPDPTELPEGCKFNPRCPNCKPECCQGEVPHYQDGEHQIKCWMFADAEKQGE